MGTISDNPSDNSVGASSPPSNFYDEERAFSDLLPELRRDYPAQFVAIADQNLVDHDTDPFELGKRIRAKFKGRFVLIRSVDHCESSFDIAKP